MAPPTTLTTLQKALLQEGVPIVLGTWSIGVETVSDPIFILISKLADIYTFKKPS